MAIVYDWPTTISAAAEARLSVKVLDAAFESAYTGQLSVEASHNERWVYELSWPVMSTAEGHAMELLLLQLAGRRNWVRVPIWHAAAQAASAFTVNAGLRARVATCSTPPPVGTFFTIGGDTLKRTTSAPSGNEVAIAPLNRNLVTSGAGSTVAPHGLFHLLDSDTAVEWDGCEPSCDLTLIEAF